MKRVFTRLAALTLIPAAFAVAACGSGDGVYTDKKDSDGNLIQKAQISETKTLITGDVFWALDNGIHTVTLSRDSVHTPNDLTCVLFKDKEGGTDSAYAFGGASCNWLGAYGFDKLTPEQLQILSQTLQTMIDTSKQQKPLSLAPTLSPSTNGPRAPGPGGQ